MHADREEIDANFLSALNHLLERIVQEHAHALAAFWAQWDGQSEVSAVFPHDLTWVNGGPLHLHLEIIGGPIDGDDDDQ